MFQQRHDTLLGGSAFSLGVGLPQNLKQAKRGSKRKTFCLPPPSLVHMFSQSVTSPSCSPSLSNLPSFPRVCHGFDSSSVPLFNNVAAAHPPCPIPYPAPPPLPFFFTEADTVQKKSTMGCIKQPCRLRISPENTKQPLICFPPSSPLTLISRSAPWGFNSPHKKREAEKVVS